MRRLSQVGSLLPAILALGFATGAARAQDPLEVAPGNHKVLLENERVRVIEFRSQPGDKIPMHSHPAYLVYDIEPGSIKITKPDGRSRTESGNEPGEVTWQEAGAHEIENVGKTETLALIVELKEGPKVRKIRIEKEVKEGDVQDHDMEDMEGHEMEEESKEMEKEIEMELEEELDEENE